MNENLIKIYNVLKLVLLFFMWKCGVNRIMIYNSDSYLKPSFPRRKN